VRFVVGTEFAAQIHILIHYGCLILFLYSFDYFLILRKHSYYAVSASLIDTLENEVFVCKVSRYLLNLTALERLVLPPDDVSNNTELIWEVLAAVSQITVSILINVCGVRDGFSELKSEVAQST
jgi:hypothetical protein